MLAFHLPCIYGDGAQGGSTGSSDAIDASYNISSFFYKVLSTHLADLHVCAKPAGTSCCLPSDQMGN